MKRSTYLHRVRARLGRIAGDPRNSFTMNDALSVTTRSIEDYMDERIAPVEAARQIALAMLDDRKNEIARREAQNDEIERQLGAAFDRQNEGSKS